MSYYHYTKGCHLSNIVKDGIIKTTNNGCENKEKPAAWLTKSPEWDVACNIGIVNNYDELVIGKIYSFNEIDSVTVNNEYMKKKIGMCRILINEILPTISFAKFKYVSKISEEGYYALDSYSRSKGSPTGQWLCTFNPIPKKYWEAIEMFVDDQWVRWDEKISIEDFIDICMSLSLKQANEEILRQGLQNVHAQCQNDFIEDHYDEIIRLWEANKHKKGYIEIYVTNDYKPHPCGFEFIEKRVRKSTFKPFSVFEGENYAFVHFLWEATFIQYRMALAYDEEILVDSYKSICN